MLPSQWFKDLLNNCLAKLHDLDNRLKNIERTIKIWDQYMAKKFDAAGNLVDDSTPLTGRKTYTALSAIDGTSTPKFVCFDPAGSGKVQYCQKTANSTAFTDANVDAGANAMWIAIADSTTGSLATNGSGSFIDPSYGTVTGFTGLIPGEKYYIGAAGAIVVFSSLSTGDWSCYVGIAASSTALKLEHGSVPFQK